MESVILHWEMRARLQCDRRGLQPLLVLILLVYILCVEVIGQGFTCLDRSVVKVSMVTRGRNSRSFEVLKRQNNIYKIEAELYWLTLNIVLLV